MEVQDELGYTFISTFPNSTEVKFNVMHACTLFEYVHVLCSKSLRIKTEMSIQEN